LHHSEKPSTQLFIPVNKGSESYFLSCSHFQYPLKPLFAICVTIFCLYSTNISWMS